VWKLTLGLLFVLFLLREHPVEFFSRSITSPKKNQRVLYLFGMKITA
jgi:hypothetical protein